MSAEPNCSSGLSRVARRAIALDEAGTQLDVLIRIAPDGRVYFHDIPLGMLAVAAAIAPDDPVLAQRQHAAEQYRSSTP